MANDAVTERLVRVGSEARAQVLAQEAAKASPAQARKLLAEWFNLCDALEPWADQLRAQFERVGFVSDSDTPAPKPPLVVYRAAWNDGDPVKALSWTGSLDRAKWFAKYLTGVRAQWLGMKRTDGQVLVYRGLCTEMFGYLTSRGEEEVIAKSVIDIEPILALVTVPAAEEVSM